MITVPVPRNLAELQTPAPLVDAAILAANLARMAQAWPGERLRPHVKAHKCTELARHQRGRGHPGFTCATIREAEGMAAAGLGCLAPGEEAVVGVDHDGGAVAVQTARAGLGWSFGARAGGVTLADSHQGVSHPLIERCVIPVAATGPGDE